MYLLIKFTDSGDLEMAQEALIDAVEEGMIIKPFETVRLDADPRKEEQATQTVEVSS